MLGAGSEMRWCMRMWREVKVKKKEIDEIASGDDEVEGEEGRGQHA